ncbi:MAG TPA: hypothetical protein VLM37_00055 [Fibrobacteraceae bacterium]|nr:hypothetical protein [Fibrobacteraceae bacterium]
MVRILGLLGCALACLAALGCDSGYAPHIEFGHDYNGYARRVMDTTSDFHLNDPFTMQVFNEGEFQSDSLEIVVYRGTAAMHGELLFTQKIMVQPNSKDMIVRGTSNKPLSARGFLRTSAVGSYFLEARDGDRFIAGKELKLHNSKE